MVGLSGMTWLRCALSLFVVAIAADGGTAIAADSSNEPEKRNVTRSGRDELKRVALVIGNSSYVNIPKLKNARQDALAVAATLRSMGFDVIEKLDVQQREMKAAVRELESKLNKSSIGVLFYAGHGMQIRGNNYLLPVDMPYPENERQLEDESIELNQLLLNISRAAKLTMFIVDACRDKPVAFKDTRDAGSPGLAKPEQIPDGVVVLYSAGAGQQALDNLGKSDTNPNGLFTRELLRQIKTPGLPVNELAQNVYERVKSQAARIGHEQTPGYYGQSERFALVPGGMPAFPATVSSAAPSVLEIEIEYWRTAEKANSKGAYEGYLQKYPSGQFVALARAAIENLDRKPALTASLGASNAATQSSTNPRMLLQQMGIAWSSTGITDAFDQCDADAIDLFAKGDFDFFSGNTPSICYFAYGRCKTIPKAAKVVDALLRNGVDLSTQMKCDFALATRDPNIWHVAMGWNNLVLLGALLDKGLRPPLIVKNYDGVSQPLSVALIDPEKETENFRSNPKSRLCKSSVSDGHKSRLGVIDLLYRKGIFTKESLRIDFEKANIWGNSSCKHVREFVEKL